MQLDDAHDIDVVISMYNLIEYSDNSSKTNGILWQYCRNKPALLMIVILMILMKIILILTHLKQ